MSKINKQYIIDNTNLMKEWDYEKNKALGISPDAISYGSHQVAWWKCANGHSWSSIVSNRARLGRSCPYCAGQRPVIGQNDLCITHPELIQEWNYDKNAGISPKEYMGGSHKIVWWKCKEGHEWSAQIKSRATGVGCPYCAGKKVLSGFNDLETFFPDLSKEWHPHKNGTLTPSQVTFGSGKTVWWICKNGHEWTAAIYNRTYGRGCPICSYRRRTSFPEQAIFYYVKQEFPDAINRYKGFTTGAMELDIYIPQINVGIEYDGKLFHSNDNSLIRDTRKYDLCKKKGIKLIRITDINNTEMLSNCDYRITLLAVNNPNLDCAISELLMILGKPNHVNVADHRLEILKYLTAFDESLEEKFPEIAIEWNYNKNGFSPRNIHPGSNEKVWWICSKCGHEWRTSPAERTGRDQTGCKICSRKIGAKKRIQTNLSKNGSIAEKTPHLLDDWDYNKNEISPDSISCTSSKRVWWICKNCGYGWQTSIAHRVSRNSGCPCCRNQVVIEGINDLCTSHPFLVEEWNFNKNTIKPTEISSGSSKKIWWICKVCGHEWCAVMNSRAKGCGCPACGYAKRNQRQRLLQEKNIQIIADYRKDNPEATISECARSVGLSYPTVQKYWEL